VTAITEESPTEQGTTEFLWLDLTRKCQLACTHCYNASGADGSHGSMSREDWFRLLDEAAGCGVRRVQLIGGEPTMHPDALALVDRALSLGLAVEVYSNLVHVSAKWWTLLQREGVSLATSYYSDDPAEHDAVTGRPSHRMTRANIENAVRLGVPLRAGIIATAEGQRVDEARRDLESLGVTRISVDHARPFGRAAEGQQPDASGLCGRCGTGKAAIGPDGNVSPCVFSGWMGVGNVRTDGLADILGGSAMAEANAAIRHEVAAAGGVMEGCEPGCEPNAACGPGSPGSECPPRV
jgi:MoaA/NifB/PqqE/SkfB family radical SAM enzyme